MNVSTETSPGAAAISADALFAKLAALGDDSYDPETCARLAGTIAEIVRLKRVRRAVILAHNYQRPEIFEVADFIGDSFELARKAREVRDADVIVFCGVHFMAETAKVFNPDRKVLLPDLRAGCSLADAVTAEALAERKAELRALYPDLKVVSYVNCTADVKALSDACCTSANAVKVVERIDSEHILFVPDQNLANYVQSKTKKQIISWDGNCYVHHQITPEEVEPGEERDPRNQVVIAHPECRKDVLAFADAVLSTSAMMRLRTRKRGREIPGGDRVRAVGPPADGDSRQALLQGVQAMPLHEDDHARGRARFAAPPPLRDHPRDEVREGAKRALERMLELGA